tara:strand:- start:211 stop:405 length:195 start_codon:yes stop_codon:yes gene_type:complete
MTAYTYIDIQDQDGNILLTTGEMILAIEFIKEQNLNQIDQVVLPEISEEGDLTGQNIIVITVGE